MSTELKKQAQGTVTAPKNGSLAFYQKTFGAYQIQIEQAAPKKAISATRAIAICSQYYASRPELHNCDVGSMIGAVLVSTAMGLNPMLREVYFVPFSNKIQLVISYGGWIKLATKSGAIKDIDARCVYEGDSFDPDFEARKPNHKMGANYGDPEKVTHAYCVVEMASGGKQMEILTKRMIERLRMKSPMQKNGIKGPWATDYDKMAIAKVIKQALRLVPMEDEWRSYTFADESINSIETAKSAVEDGQYDYEISEAKGGDAPVANVVVQTEEEKNQAAYDSQMAKENSGGGTLPFQG